MSQNLNVDNSKKNMPKNPKEEEENYEYEEYEEKEEIQNKNTQEENNKIEIPEKNILKEKINQKEIVINNEQNEIINTSNQKKENENKNETNQIEEINTNPPKSKNSKKLHEDKNFEENIIEAYKNLSKINNIESRQSTKDEDEDEEEEEKNNEEQSKINSNLEYCEKKLRAALNICQNDPYLIINRNIIDKLSRIIQNDKMNLNFIIGDIYISLMNKESLFNYDDKEFEINDLMIFVNKVIQFKDIEIMNNTKLGVNYINCLTKFLLNISNEFDLDEYQLNCIYEILYLTKEINHVNLKKETFTGFLISLSQELERQPNIYEQYKIFKQNKLYFLYFIQNCEEKNTSLYEDYIKIGKILACLFFNKDFTLILDVNKENEIYNDTDGIRHLLYDGNEDKGDMKVINDNIFYVYEGDEVIDELREELCEIILKYIEKFIVLIDFYSMQYLIYVLIKRIYFSHYKQYKKRVDFLLVDSLINMCFFKEAPLKLISNFINKILKSTKEEELELKNILIENLRMAKKEKKFLYKFPKFFSKFEIKNNDINNNSEDEKEAKEEEEETEEEEDDDDISEINSRYSNEILLMYHNDLNIGFFNHLEINAGEKFIFYESINHEFSVLDFCLRLEDYDIKITITDLTEDRIIYTKDRLNSAYETPLKIIMFFTNPKILKFEIDNTYSWLRKKVIKYKTNVFYPKYPYSINHDIIVEKYQKQIIKIRNEIMQNKKKNKKKQFIYDEADKILILKVEGENKVINCVNVKQNLSAINKLVKKKYLFVSSLFIKIKNPDNNEDKSYFYFYKENEGLIETELSKESIENYLSNLLPKSNEKINIINLYIINGDLNARTNNYSLKKILGFDPFIKINGNLQKILFFVQNLSQSQLYYYLYQQVNCQQQIDIILLVNYTKYGGYQIILLYNDEIISYLDDFKGLNKNESIDKNVKIICDGIEKLIKDDRKIDIVLTVSMDDKENVITSEKLEGEINKYLENYENKKNIRIIKTDLEFNIDLQINSHIFYLND